MGGRMGGRMGKESGSVEGIVSLQRGVLALFFDGAGRTLVGSNRTKKKKRSPKSANYMTWGLTRIRLTLVRLRTKGTLFRTKLTPFPSNSVAETLARVSGPESEPWEMGTALVVVQPLKRNAMTRGK
jgi:hypothetical protein